MKLRKPSFFRELIGTAQRVFSALGRVWTYKEEKLINKILVFLLVIFFWWFLIPVLTIQEYITEKRAYKIRGGNKK